MSRIVSAGLALVCVTSVGMTTTSCGLLPGSSRGGAPSSTSASATSGSVAPPADGNPYSLPDDQKPALFDPCTEIPREVFADPVYEGLDPKDDDPKHDGNALHACAWTAHDYAVDFVSGWKSVDDVKADGKYKFAGDISIGGRIGTKTEASQNEDYSYCTYIFFTSRGSLLINLDMREPLPSRKKFDLGNACQTLTRVLEPIAPHFPAGDFR